MAEDITSIKLEEAMQYQAEVIPDTQIIAMTAIMEEEMMSELTIIRENSQDILDGAIEIHHNINHLSRRDMTLRNIQEEKNKGLVVPIDMIRREIEMITDLTSELITEIGTTWLVMIPDAMTVEQVIIFIL